MTPEEHKAWEDKMTALHALLMGAIVRAGLDSRDAWVLGIKLLSDIVTRTLKQPTPENIASALEALVREQAREIREGTAQPERMH